ncbi:putative arginyl-trna synthetase protein [Phaeoacremonium minimum UCRPA7]|uniref:arginine--tRNA ligase n=1 Tax=Phaeoacremonium minimum (strain UCR-PA7) TaxID=1286976 RepID=R8BUX9_PHAM7|nr:putative arginyl-trna synthetase protein [Phaeoacremonium minimum UCRPA7]EOO03176.1 putative arginyl-trna synthetase protein [Phaeoacremonium minimum UCRPA7]
MFEPRSLARLLLPYIHDRKALYGSHVFTEGSELDEAEKKKLLIEFSSPNIASEFQGKHLRSTIIGAHIGLLYESMGWDVTRVNYLGDWGKNIGLLGAGWEDFGSEEQFAADPIGHLVSVYNQANEIFIPEQASSKKARDAHEDTVEIESKGYYAKRNDFFKKMEDGDEVAVGLSKRFRDVYVDHYKELYARLNVTFDEYSGESQVSPETMTEVEEILKSKGLSEEKDGAWMIELKKHGGKGGAAIIRDRTGSSTYLLRDLATVLERFRKYSFDKMIYVVSVDHDLHFQRVLKILDLMDMSHLAERLQHVHFSKVSPMVDQGSMLGDILSQCQSSMLESLRENPDQSALLGDSEDVAASLGISALLVQELSARRAADHAFDIARMTSFELGTGPELQYCYARLTSLLADKSSDASALTDDELESITGEAFVDLLRLLAQYPDVTAQEFKALESATVMAYLTSVTGQLSGCFEEIPEGADLTVGQVMLLEAARQVLENAMRLLGIVPTSR